MRKIKSNGKTAIMSCLPWKIFIQNLTDSKHLRTKNLKQLQEIFYNDHEKLDWYCI
jgi:hypothetical protein